MYKIGFPRCLQEYQASLPKLVFKPYSGSPLTFLSLGDKAVEVSDCSSPRIQVRGNVRWEAPSMLKARTILHEL